MQKSVLFLLITVFGATKRLGIVTCLLKAGITVPQEIFLARDRLCKHVSTASDSRDRNNRYIRNTRRTVSDGVFYEVRVEVT